MCVLLKAFSFWKVFCVFKRHLIKVWIEIETNSLSVHQFWFSFCWKSVFVQFFSSELTIKTLNRDLIDPNCWLKLKGKLFSLFWWATEGKEKKIETSTFTWIHSLKKYEEKIELRKVLFVMKRDILVSWNIRIQFPLYEPRAIETSHFRLWLNSTIQSLWSGVQRK